MAQELYKEKEGEKKSIGAVSANGVSFQKAVGCRCCSGPIDREFLVLT